jgi:hypothetical protein
VGRRCLITYVHGVLGDMARLVRGSASALAFFARNRHCDINPENHTLVRERQQLLSKLTLDVDR